MTSPSVSEERGTAPERLNDGGIPPESLEERWHRITGPETASQLTIPETLFIAELAREIDRLGRVIAATTDASL